MELVSVAAIADNRVIGDDGDLPWPSIPADKQQYRERIADDPVILGRVTFESMLDDLPGAAQIVLSRSEQDFDTPTAHHASGVDDAVAVAEELGADTAYVIGGGGIYDLFQPHIDRMVLSRVSVSTRVTPSIQSGTRRRGNSIRRPSMTASGSKSGCGQTDGLR